ncbi:MAG TPA: phage terminase small subunit P27 family, partial [Thermaerobacter sp.]
EWQKVTAALDGLGILTNADVNTLAVYCDAAARYAEAARMVQEQGAVIDVGRGPQQNPAVLVAEKYFRIMQKAASALGLDPTSRAALAKYQAEAGRQDEFDRLFGTG